MHKVTDNVFIETVLDADIGGTNATSEYVNMAEYEAVCFYIQLGDSDGDGTFSNWDSSDELDSCIAKEATDSSGTSAQTLSDQSSAVDEGGTGTAAGQRYAVNVKASDLTDGYDYVALYVAEGGNTGVDNVHVVAVGINPRYATANEIGITAADIKDV